MIWLIGNDLDFERAKQIQQLRTPLLELNAIMAHHHGDWMKELGNSVDLVENLPSPRFIKSHLPWELLPKDLKVVEPKVRIFISIFSNFPTRFNFSAKSLLSLSGGVRRQKSQRHVCLLLSLLSIGSQHERLLRRLLQFVP